MNPVRPDVEPMALHRTQYTIEVGRPTGEQNADTIVVDKLAREVPRGQFPVLAGLFIDSTSL